MNCINLLCAIDKTVRNIYGGNSIADLIENINQRKRIKQLINEKHFPSITNHISSPRVISTFIFDHIKILNHFLWNLLMRRYKTLRTSSSVIIFYFIFFSRWLTSVYGRFSHILPIS